MKIRTTGLILATIVIVVAPRDHAVNRAAEDATSAQVETINEPPVTDADRDHWAFRPLLRPDVPAVKNSVRPRNPIDCFIFAKLERAGLSLAPEADRGTLIRRLSFDLTGLPSTPAEIVRFQRDRAPNAYERLVDWLLASDAYGRRWAQHWLDLARFAETDGFEHDKLRPNAWRYRDWVVDALNADMPYDRFVQQQIAGDLLNPDDPSAAIPTGFLLAGPDMPDINLQNERLHSFLNDATATVGSVFLAMNVGCAQCHDHKFDPVSQADFYRLRAFFDNAEVFREHPVAGPAELAEQKRLEKERGERWLALEQSLKELQANALARLRKEQNDPALNLRGDALVARFNDAEKNSHKRLTAELDRVKKQKPPALPMGRVVKEQSGKPTQSHLWIRGDFRRKGPRLEPAFLRVVNSGVERESPTERLDRVDLARWLTRPDHPLATRTIVNRLWQHHFGRGLSTSPSSFGVMGDEPTHPDLLDWLAVEFTGPAGFSLKRMHRLMVTSATYRQAGRPFSDGRNNDWRRSLQRDPENELWSRMPRRRLSGEEIRDALLFVSGRLSQRRGGPGVRPPLPDELVSTLLKNQWPVAPDAEDHNRASLYLFVRRNLRYPLFDAFDRPDTNASCPRRGRSTTAPQALTLLNSELTLTSARALASLLIEEVGRNREAIVAQCYQRTLGRLPHDEEQRTAVAFLDASIERSRESGSGDPFAAAVMDFCLAGVNLNEFVYVD